MIFEKYAKLLLLISICLITACTKPEKVVKKTRFLLDTICEITVLSPDVKLAEQVVDKTFQEIERIDRVCGYKSYSEVYQINRASGKNPVKVSRELVDLIFTAIQISSLTAGAFDITVHPLSLLWGFGTENKNVPAINEIKRINKLVNYKNIIIDKTNSTVFLNKTGMGIDLGGIAKGYAVGRSIEIIKQSGISKAMVNLGGDIQVIGDRGNGEPWRIGVQHPRKPDHLVTVLPYKNMSVVTSGDYERYFFAGKERYHHILDPQTGYPTKNGCISVTVINNDPTVGDGLSTGVFVLGTEKGIKLLENLPDTEGIIISETVAGTKLSLTTGIKNLNLEYTY